MGYHTSCPSVASGIQVEFMTTDGVWNRPACFFAMDKSEKGEEDGKVSDVHCDTGNGCAEGYDFSPCQAWCL